MGEEREEAAEYQLQHAGVWHDTPAFPTPANQHWQQQLSEMISRTVVNKSWRPTYCGRKKRHKDDQTLRRSTHPEFGTLSSTSRQVQESRAGITAAIIC
jgi:hypothetical protein